MNTAELQALIDAAGPGGTATIPAGTHTVGTIYFPSDITIQGADTIFSSIVKLADGTNDNVFRPYNPDTGNSNVIFKNFKIDGNKANNTGNPCHGIALYKTTDVLIEAMWIVDCWKDAIYIGVATVYSLTSGPSERVEIRYCTLEGMHRHGITVTNGIDINAHNNIIQEGDDSGFHIETNVSGDHAQQIDFINNLVKNIGKNPEVGGAGTGKGFTIQAGATNYDMIRCVGNYFFCDHSDGMRAINDNSPTASYVEIIGNVSAGTINVGLLLFNGAHDVVIFGNRLSTTRLLADYYQGIWMTGTVTDITIRGNYTYNFGYGIGGAGATTFTNIYIGDNASNGYIGIDTGSGTHINETVENNETPTPTTDKVLTSASYVIATGYVAVLNWDDSSIQTGDLSGLSLAAANFYSLLNAYDLTEDRKAFRGSSASAVDIPMTGWTVDIGGETMANLFPEFGCFVVEDNGLFIVHSRSGTESRLTVGDVNGRVLAELEADIGPVVWRLNEIGKVDFSLASRDSKAIRKYLSIGNRVLLEFRNGLPDWGGTIELPREWSGGQIKLTALSAENLLNFRITDKTRTFTQATVGSIARSLLEDVRARSAFGIDRGQIWAGGEAHDIEFHFEPLFNIIKNELCGKLSTAEFDVTPVLQNGMISFLFNLYEKKGRRQKDVKLVEDKNLADARMVEQGELVNSWYVAGSGNDWGDTRLVGHKEASGSIGKYGLREKAQTSVDLSTQSSLDEAARSQLIESFDIRAMFELTAVDLLPATFASYGLGDEIGVELYSYGFEAYQGTVRVLGREFDLATGLCRLAVQQVLEG